MSEIKTEKIVCDNGDIIITETDENKKLIYYCESRYVDEISWNGMQKILDRIGKDCYRNKFWEHNKNCMTCYHPISESTSCNREDCEFGGKD